jgi:ABC-type branched-subunit amino acid transport system ATPase component
VSALLEVDRVTRRFGGLTAVLEVTLDVEEGSAVGLIGANGAGKTTLFNCLTGFDTPTSGDVRLRGRSLIGQRRHEVVRSGVARTFQIVRPFKDLPVLAHVLIPLIALVDRVVAMDQGQVIADGAPLEVMKDPAVVTAYLGGGSFDGS